MYDNILVPITDGRRMYQISVPLKEAYETQGHSIVLAFEKAILLHSIDNAWKENLRALDDLKTSVQNASYEQKDPLLIFKLESVKLFDSMVNDINYNTVSVLMRCQLPVEDSEEVREAPAQVEETPRSKMKETKEDITEAGQEPIDTRAQENHQPVVNEQPKIGRNDPCPCGSGKKYKNCHGKGL